jgi:hypothetical protein
MWHFIVVTCLDMIVVFPRAMRCEANAISTYRVQTALVLKPLLWYLLSVSCNNKPSINAGSLTRINQAP